MGISSRDSAVSAVAVGLVALTGFTGGETGKAFDKLPTWLLSLIVLRAGVVEELCYRGYAIERLHALGRPRWVAAGVPLLIFGVGHWTGGWANIVMLSFSAACSPSSSSGVATWWPT